jgi:hypothetical protein
MDTTPMLSEAQRAELIASWRRQVQHENEALGRLLDNLEKVRQLLLVGTVAAVDEAQVLQRALESLPGELERNRARWLDTVAVALAMPREAVRVRTFAERIAGPERNEILVDRQRLRDRATQVAALGRTVRICLRTRLDMLRRFFIAVTGVDTTPNRYGRAGRSVAPSYGSILERRG